MPQFEKTKKEPPTVAAVESSDIVATPQAATDTTEIIPNEAAEVKEKDLNALNKKLGKSREWMCLVYEDSAPPDWKEKVQRTFLESYLSKHDKDHNPGGELKKLHWHVVLSWPGPTTFLNAKNTMESFGGVILPESVKSLRGICRYLCHLDNPEKAQYDPKDVICYNGADYLTAISLKSDKYVSIAEMQDFCDKYNIFSYRLLSQYARKHRPADWWRCLCDNGSFVMGEYLKSRKWEDERGFDIPLEVLENDIEGDNDL